MPDGLQFGDVAASYGQMVAQAGGQAKLNNSNMMQYNIQRQDSFKDWQLQQEYNSPVNMVNRLKQAGFSPHSLQGQASLVSAGRADPIRPTQMQNNNMMPSTNMAQMMMSMEQLKLMRAQTEKTQAETNSVNADVQSKGLNYEVDSRTLLDRRVNEVMQQVSTLQNSQVDTQVKKQTLENMKASLADTLEDVKLKQIEALYREPMLLGKNQLQNAQVKQVTAQINHIHAEIQNLNVRTKAEAQQLPFRLEQINQQIQQLKLINEKGNMENQQLPNKLILENNLNQENLRGKKWDNDYKGTIDPQLQRLIDYGGDKLSSFTKFGKLNQVQPSLRKYFGH
jgi:hypothetical protein